MEASIETSQTAGASKPKPTPAPKPRLTPKPFSLQKNTTIRSIHAPKTVNTNFKSTTNQTGKPEATGVPKPTLTANAQKPPQQTSTSDSKPSSVSVHIKDKPKNPKESRVRPHEEDSLDSNEDPGKNNCASQTAPPTETPKSQPLQKDDVIQTNNKSSTNFVTNSEQKDGKNTEEETQTSVIQKPEEPGSKGSSTTNPTYRWGGTKKCLSTELTSKFESDDPSLPPQQTITVSTNDTRDYSNESVYSAPEQSQTTTAPPNTESDEGGLKKDYSVGGSIKRRISLLFDSSLRPEVMTKREEPEIINSTGGVKERIKHWAAETRSEDPKTEKKPQVAPRPRSRSFEPATVQKAEKTPKMPHLEPPTVGTQDVVPHSEVLPAEPPLESLVETSKEVPTERKSLKSSTETPREDEQNKSTEGEVRLRNRSPSTTQTDRDEGDSASSECAHPAPERNSVKRRSVRFGVVDRNDGGPPVTLGSPSESTSEEEEEAPEDKAEDDTSMSLPDHRQAGNLQKKEDEIQKREEEQLKHLEFEQRRRAEENEEARLKFEEERKQEEEENEKEHLREREELRLREEEKRREEERERQKLNEDEIERQQKEEMERERLQREEMEKERRMEVIWQRQRKEERDRAKQKEERLKQDQKERENERMEEEKRKEEKLREEREGQRLREGEEKSIYEHKEHRFEEELRDEEINKAKRREEEWEQEWVKKTESLRGEEEEREREKELELMLQRRKEQDRERARQIEERLKQEERQKERLREEAEESERERQRKLEEEERVKERQRQEEEERKRQELERKMQQEKEEEMERMRQIEKQRQEDKREEERKRQMEKERVEGLEKKMQEELERKGAKELEEKLGEDEEREKEELGLTHREGESTVDEADSNLISFDSDDEPEKSKTPQSPLAKFHEPTESAVEVVYDDFSVRKPLIEVDFDDFSVKPKRWGSLDKAETSPVVQSWETNSGDIEDVEVLVPLNVCPQEKKVPEPKAKPDKPEPTPAEEKKEEEEEEAEAEEEEQLISMEEEEEEDKKEVNSYCINGEDKDTDALIEIEPDQQNGRREQTSETDSPNPIPDEVPEASSQGIDTTDFQREPQFAPFPEKSTPLLDTSAQRSKADVGKRRIRSRPSRSLRAGLTQRESPDWRARDSTDEREASSKQRESDSEEEQPKPKIVCSPPPTSQRVPMFPGLSPAALIAQLKRRTGGGGEETKEDKGREERGNQHEEIAPSPPQLSRSPRSAAHLAGAARVLPPLGATDTGANSSPAWLKELKSKKRLSQHDSEA